MLKFQKVESWCSTYDVLADEGMEKPEVVARIEQRDSWSAPTARKRWALDLPGVRGEPKRTLYFDTFADAKRGVQRLFTHAFRELAGTGAHPELKRIAWAE